MDTILLVSLLQTFAYLLLVFSLLLVIALWQGRYTIINIILALELSLLLFLAFPLLDQITAGKSNTTTHLIELSIFITLTIFSYLIFRRHIPGDDYEKTFSNFWQKLLLTTVATGLLLAISYQILPVSEFINLDNPIKNIFTGEINLYLWLIAPLVLLFFV